MSFITHSLRLETTEIVNVSNIPAMLSIITMASCLLKVLNWTVCNLQVTLAPSLPNKSSMGLI